MITKEKIEEVLERHIFPSTNNENDEVIGVKEATEEIYKLLNKLEKSNKELPEFKFTPPAPKLVEINTELKKINQSIGNENVLLCDVLKWHSLNDRDKYSHFEVSKGVAYFSIYDGEEHNSIFWDLSDVYLKNQSKELINWLAEII